MYIHKHLFRQFEKSIHYSRWISNKQSSYIIKEMAGKYNGHNQEKIYHPNDD